MHRSHGSPSVGYLILSLLGVLMQRSVHAEWRELPTAPVYNLSLRTDSTPDLSDIDSYLRSITSQHATAQDKAIAIWRWSQRMRKQTSNPIEDGQHVLDPIVLFNNFGHCNCGIISGLNNTFWLNMGWRAHYVQLGDHTVCETSWDDGKSWHMFDASMSFYCFNDTGQVAGVAEIEKNPHYYLRNFAPEVGTNPVQDINDHQGWRQASDRPVHYHRTLANGYDSFKAPNSISGGGLHAQWGQRFAINLRENEHYTRYFGHLAEVDKSRTFRPLETGKDPEGQHRHLGIRANGVWRYAPDLRSRFADQLVYDSAGVTFGDARSGFAIKPADANAAGTLLLRIPASNVVTSAKLSLEVSRLSVTDGVSVSVSRTAGTSYQPVWSCTERGSAMAFELDLQPFVAGVSEYLVRVQIQGAGAGLESVVVDTITQINRAALPRLSRGGNRVQLVLGTQAETVQFLPSIVTGNHSQTVHEQESIDVETEVGFYKPILRPAEANTAAHVTWKIATPTPITAINYGGTICVKTANDRATLLHSFDGQTFVPDYEKADGDEPFDLMINRDVTPIPVGQREAYLRYEFQTQQYPRSYAGPGIQAARMLVQHEPRVKGFTPIEVTYCWIEHRESGDVERQHTQRIASPAEEYSINVGGYRDPTMQWVRLNLQGSAPADGKVTYGYSDGVDIGSGAAVKPALYEWGRNIALGKRYTLTGPQHAKNLDAGGDLTDGIIAPPDEDVSESYMPTNVMFEQDATAVITLDLGKTQKVAAVRIHAGQEAGFKLAYPKVIRVEVSEDGQNFSQTGEATHHQVFDPPANFQPWEHDDSPQYAMLPAGGRLAYAYRVVLERPQAARFVRVTCEALNGWGILLSEVQVFDQVAVQQDVPPHVYLPPLKQLAQPSPLAGSNP
ncbi:discoidin domain-containing protein [Aureliella helgolandensis]|nr:discoidin domain-containing protein [Aureliella helgolandensis]